MQFIYEKGKNKKKNLLFKIVIKNNICIVKFHAVG